MAGKSILDLPGPRALPIIGNYHQIDSKKFHRNMVEWAGRYGTMYRIRLGSRPAVIISDPHLIIAILKERPHHFRRFKKLSEILTEVGGHGLFSAEGADWTRQRSMIARGFSMTQIRAFYPTLLALVVRLQERLIIASRSSAGVDVQKEFMRFTVDVTSNLAFGYDPKALIDDRDQLQNHLEKLFPALSRRLTSPFAALTILNIKRYRAVLHAMEEVDKVIQRLITEARTRLKEQPQAKAKTVLDAMILSGPADDAELRGNIVTLMLAGEDTTANSLAWTVHYLTERPEIFLKIREEAEALVPGKETEPSIEHIEKLKWVEAAANEAMRLRPVAPFLFIEPLEDTEINGYDIKKGTLLSMLLMSNYLKAEYFSDPERYFPERWMDGERPNEFNHHPQVFMPFGFGPRFCPGAMLAMIEMKSVLCMLAKNFDIKKIPGNQPEEVFNFTMMPQNLFVQFTSRRHASPN